MYRQGQRRGARRTGFAALLGIALLAVPAIGAPIARAGTTIAVTTTNQEVNGDADCSLQEAIYAANRDASTAPDAGNPGQDFTTGCDAGSGADVIELPLMSVFSFSDGINDPDNYVGPSVTPIITSAITIEGHGARLQRSAAGFGTRAFVVDVTGDLDLREVHVKGFAIHGGNGADGGGGGMGAGGAIFVQGGTLLVQWSTFEGNAVHGGNGSFYDTIANGGGGGTFGNGGEAAANDVPGGGGGGGGARGDGGQGGNGAGDQYGGGGGGRITSASQSDRGEPCGGSGGVSDFSAHDGADDGQPGVCAGGGGGGGTDAEPPADAFCGGDGGDGADYGGGGGGGLDGDGGDGGFGGGGGGGGGFGGFGGGGGSREHCSVSPQDGQGRTFAGDGSLNAGGGGAGLGGAIFGANADIHVVNSTFYGNSAAQGLAGSDDAHDGRGAGGAIFTIAGNLTIESSTFSGNTTATVTSGGGGAIVVYDPTDGDAPYESQEATLLLRNTIIAGNGVAECYTQNGVDTGGSDGNIVTDSTPNNLGNPRCPGVTGSDDPGLSPLALNGGRTLSMAIGPTSPAVDVAVGPIPADDQRGVLRPQGIAGDIGAYEVEGAAPPPPGEPPVTTITLTPAAPNGTNGWYVTGVDTDIEATDSDGTIIQTRCALDPATPPVSVASFDPVWCDLSGVTTDGTHTVFAASLDNDGYADVPVVSATFKIDATKPTLDPTLSVSTPIAIGQAGVTAAPNASDVTSGIASSSCGAVDTSAPGAHSVSCTATDNAGNATTTSLTYVVEYGIDGFYTPVPGSKWRAGQTVPIKIALTDGAGDRISDSVAAALAKACQVTFSAAGSQVATGKCFKYDRSSHQFVFTWKLAKSPTGDATISVQVSYAGTSTITSLSELITITP